MLNNVFDVSIFTPFSSVDNVIYTNFFTHGLFIECCEKVRRHIIKAQITSQNQNKVGNSQIRG